MDTNRWVFQWMSMFVVLLVGLSNVYANPLSQKDIPEPLQAWVDWVSFGHEDRHCPFVLSNAKQRFCAWPDALTLDLSNSGGTFSQVWQTYHDSWVALPGEVRYWPTEVMINDKPALVVNRRNAPAVYLAAGQHAIQGRFIWSALPKSLAIPESTALIELVSEGKPIVFPRIEKQRLWLQATQQKKIEDRFEFQVFRHIDDAIPTTVTFHFAIQVAGSAREVVLGIPMAGFIPLRLKSTLPARLDTDNSLRLQVRPGRWVVELTARHRGPLNELVFNRPPGRWVDEEIWVFNARPDLRLVEIVDGVAIDPQQTLLPDAWKRLPAYRLRPGEKISLQEQRRGDPDPGPDQLSLQRTLWLNFAGDEYTLLDQISGMKKNNWRLEMNAPIKLGQVIIDDKAQFITQREASELTGVEIRRGNIQLTADSLLSQDIQNLPAIGWNQDFDRVITTLNLPPGWRVLAATGADRISPTWLTQWTLLDIFLVLLMSLAIAKLWNKPLAVIALVTLVITYHEPGAPVAIWLFLIVGFALLRVLPKGRFRTLVWHYRNITLLGFVIITIPFVVQQVRQSIYPQLEQPWVSVSPHVDFSMDHRNFFAVTPQKGVLDEALDKVMERNSGKTEVDYSSSIAPTRTTKMQHYDPKSVLQTGPGLPQWTWNQVDFSWSGPVERNQKIKIFYLDSTANVVLAWLRVILISALIIGLFNVKFSRKEGIQLPSLKSLSAIMLVSLFAVSMVLGSNPAVAAYPDTALLKQLEKRLFIDPVCLPKCAEVQWMKLRLSADTLHLEMQLHSYEPVAVPLPGQAEQWLPQRIFVNQQRASGIVKDETGTWWLMLSKGQHTVSLEGVLPPVDTIQIPLPLKPHYVEVISDGWNVLGVHADGTIDQQLQLSRMVETESNEVTGFNATNLPPFLKVERKLLLDLIWRVNTRITRLSPLGSGIVLDIPLLPGESVTTEGVRVENGHVRVSLGTHNQQTQWQSLLTMQDAQGHLVEKIKLLAPSDSRWIETWLVNVAPMWHMQYQGIPVIHHEQENRWLPAWSPWPGEQLTLQLSKPVGIAGQTLTIDQSHLLIRPGSRVSNATLTFILRSSQGMQHAIVLPQDSKLLEVKINQPSYPLRLQERTLQLPVTPGKHRYVVKWQQPHGITLRHDTPPIDIGLSNVNHSIQIEMPRDRWVMFVGGPTLGPAVLFWGMLVVLMLMAFGLARFSTLTPLRYWQWVLLGIGLMPIFMESILVVVAWFFLLGYRAKLSHEMPNWQFNGYQFLIVISTVITVGTLINAVSQGLLGSPDMQIIGNASSQHVLKWYQDSSGAVLPSAWTISVPMYVYRILMLLWALWLAFSVIHWARWAWSCFSHLGYWRSIKLQLKGNGKKLES